jgi:hypothetical protein
MSDGANQEQDLESRVGQNEEIQKYLLYYASLKHPPLFAILLKGPWGAGKTWFIKRVIDELEADKKKVLYISLYGITSTQQIQEEFFRQLHPVLGSKSAKFAGILLKGLLKGTVKIDLDHDGKDGGSANVSIPDISIPEYMTDTDGVMLIFDDVERCSIPISDLLGYINYFVEHDEKKVILIGNEDEIFHRETLAGPEAVGHYARIKEKLVGKTFEITSNFRDAMQHFIAEISSETNQSILEKHLDVIEEVYMQAGYRNLRHLRQGIMDFVRLMELLSMKSMQKADLMNHLLSYFLMFSFEVKSGNLRPDDINRNHIGNSLLLRLTKSEEKTPEVKASEAREKKYSTLNWLDPLLPLEVWRSIFSTGLFDFAKINQALGNSSYFANEGQEDWIRLWNAYSLEDEELVIVIDAIIDRLRRHEFSKVGELLHVISSLLMLADQEIITESKEVILQLGIENLEVMRMSGALRREYKNATSSIVDTGYAGMGFHQVKGDYFSRFKEAVSLLGKSALEEGYPAEAAELMSVMSADTHKFFSSLVPTNYTICPYAQVPILQYTLVDKFISTLIGLTVEQKRLVTATIEGRYESEYLCEKLLNEKEWLSQLVHALAVEIDNRKGKMSGVLLGATEKAARVGLSKFTIIASRQSPQTNS